MQVCSGANPTSTATQARETGPAFPLFQQVTPVPSRPPLRSANRWLTHLSQPGVACRNAAHRLLLRRSYCCFTTFSKTALRCCRRCACSTCCSCCRYCAGGQPSPGQPAVLAAVTGPAASAWQALTGPQPLLAQLLGLLDLQVHALADERDLAVPAPARAQRIGGMHGTNRCACCQTRRECRVRGGS